MAASRAQAPFYIDDERPFAQRNDGMSLDIIHPKDIPRGKVTYPKDYSASLMTQDIDRAAPHFPHLQYLQKPDLAVGSTDPDHFGGKARTYYPPMDRRPRDLSLTTADIEYAQTKSKKPKGNRHVDPICPNYELPSCQVRPHTPPRFNGRHTHELSDIEGAKSKVRIPTRNYVRDPNDASDIEHASANYAERVQRQTRTGNRVERTLNVKDINQAKPVQPRSVNPLDPVYKVPTTATTSLHAKFNEEVAAGVELHPKEAEEHGHVHGSKPRKLQWDNGEPLFSLLREDIAGTVPQRFVGAVPFNIYDPPEVKQVISFHDPHDIPGAQVGSLKKGIEGSRRAGQTNPLNPRYRMLDGDSRPQPVPVHDAERPDPLHPLVQNRAQASSLPNLRTMQNPNLQAYGAAGGRTPNGRTPMGTPGQRTPLGAPGQRTPLGAPGQRTPMGTPGQRTPVGAAGPTNYTMRRENSDSALRRPVRDSPAGSVRSQPMSAHGAPSQSYGAPPHGGEGAYGPMPGYGAPPQGYEAPAYGGEGAYGMPGQEEAPGTTIRFDRMSPPGGAGAAYSQQGYDQMPYEM